MTALPSDSRATRSYAIPRPKRSRAPRIHRRRSLHRNGPVMAPVSTAQRMRAFWDAHAVKSGIALFWAWFTVANWGDLQSLLLS